MCVPSTLSADGGAPGLGAAHTNETDEDEKKEVNLTTTGETANQTSGNISSSQAGEDICGDAEPAVARPEEVAITGSEPDTSSSALQRRIATKQRRRLLKDRCGNAQSASREVYRLHNLVQYDHSVDEEYNCPELNELALMRRQLTQLALLASLQQESPEVRLEDLRTPAERKSDYACFGPHDPEGGAANLDKEVEKDSHSLNGTFELGTFTMVAAADASWFTREFILAHPSYLFLYGDCAPDGKSTDVISKDSMHYTRGTPLAAVCRPLPNTLPYTVCNYNGTPLTDSSAKANKLRFQKSTRRILARGRSQRIDVVVLPPDERLDLYQDFVSTAPATAASLNDQLNHIRRQAVDFVPKAKQSPDSAAHSWHTSECERSLQAGNKDFIELETNEAADQATGIHSSGAVDLDDADPTNYWSRRCGDACWASDYVPPTPQQPAIKTVNSTLLHALGASDSPETSAPVAVGPFVMGCACSNGGQPTSEEFVVCLDDGSTGLSNAVTGYIDLRLCLHLGLRINTRHKLKIRTAGSGSEGSEHTTFGSVRANFSIAGQPIGMQTYLVNLLPNSTGVLLGFNEKRRLNIDTRVGTLAAPGQPEVVFSIPSASTGGSADDGDHITYTEIRRPMIAKPARCPLKDSVDDWRRPAAQLARHDEAADAALHHQIGELLHDSSPLPAELEASELLLSFCESYQADRDRVVTETLQEMNELNCNS